MSNFALLDDNNLVVYIGDDSERASLEPNLRWVTIDPEKHHVKYGYKYDPYTDTFSRVKLSIKEEKSRLNERILLIYEDKMKMMLSGYSPYEIMTFPYQVMGLAAAERGEVDPYGTLSLNILAMSRNVPIDIMVEKVGVKTKLFLKAAFYITGVKQRFEDMIERISDQAQVDEVEAHIDHWASEELKG